MDTKDMDQSSKAEPKALFIPLKRKYFEAFKRGDKTEERRPYGARWNEKTCYIGRLVTLSLGYGKQDRLNGIIVSFCIDHQPEIRPGWRACYGDEPNTAACFGIEILTDDSR